MRDKINFESNRPVELAIEAPGVFVEGRFGDQYQYFTPDNRIFWVPPVVEKQIVELEIQPGELFLVVKSQAREGGRSVVRWIVRRDRDNTLAVPKPPERSARAPQGSSPAAPEKTPEPRTTQAQCTRRERWIELLVDAVEAVKQASSQTGRQFDGEELQDIISTLVIDQQRRDEMDLRYAKSVPSSMPGYGTVKSNGHVNGAPWSQ